MAGKGRVTILGCGSAGGVPLVTGFWGECKPDEPKNRRLRASIAVQQGDACLVVDTSPDFRAQVNNNAITKIDAILYTHAHADHVNGIDDLRYLKILQKRMVDAWGDMETFSELHAHFPHMFTASPDGLYDAVIKPTAFGDDQYGRALDIAGISVIPFRQKHGPSGRSLGYRFGDFVYSTDVSAFDEDAFRVLAGVKTWLLDGAQFGRDYTIAHPNFDMIKAWNDRVKAERVILTHLTHRNDYNAMKAALPAGYEPAHDGMVIEFNS